MSARGTRPGLLSLIRHIPAHPRAALAVGWPVLAAAMVFGWAETWAMRDSYDGVEDSAALVDAVAADFLRTLLSFFGLLLFALVSAWSAIRWHRFILAGSEVTFAPQGVGAVRFGRYLWAAILLYLLLVVVMLLISQAMLVLVHSVPHRDGGTLLRLADALALVSGLAVFWLTLRLGLVLPAAAVDRRMSLAESWRLTARAPVSLLLAALVLSVGYVGSTLLLERLPAGLALADTAFFLVDVTVLTALYETLVMRGAGD